MEGIGVRPERVCMSVKPDKRAYGADIGIEVISKAKDRKEEGVFRGRACRTSLG